jgi:hypothetical protein
MFTRIVAIIVVSSGFVFAAPDSYARDAGFASHHRTVRSIHARPSMRMGRVGSARLRHRTHAGAGLLGTIIQTVVEEALDQVVDQALTVEAPVPSLDHDDMMAMHYELIARAQSDEVRAPKRTWRYNPYVFPHPLDPSN